MTVIRSPLRYPGGKSKLFGFVASIINRCGIHSYTYSEPYAGGAGLALNLLFSGFCKTISLNDSDPAIYSFWWSVVNRNAEFLKRVCGTKFTIEEWRRQQSIWARPEESSELELGYATYYLNRTNRSGIIEGAGPIGGYQQDGPYKMDARFSLNEQLSVIKMIGDASHLIGVSNEDAAQFIVSPNRHDCELMYLDPPYYVKGQRLYRNSYSHDDHVAIASLMKDRSGYWMVSYDDVPQIRDIYRWCEPLEISLQYNAGPVGLGREVIYLSDRLRASPSVLNVA